MAARRRIFFTVCFVSLSALGLALPSAAPGLPGGDEPSREQQIKELEKQLQDLNDKLTELKKEKSKPALQSQPQTKVAVLNLSYVIKNYKKFETYQASAKRKLDGFDSHLQPLKDELDKLQKRASDGEVALAEKERIEKKVRDLTRTMQDKVDEYKKALADFDSASFTTIYNDIEKETEHYAKTHKIELVMHYNDGTTEAEVNTPTNIGRKMSLGALFPVYFTPAMDISKEILALLNEAK